MVIQMKLLGFRALNSVLAFAGLAQLAAQGPVHLAIVDSRGAPVADAQVLDAAGHVLGRSSDTGQAVFNCMTPCRVQVSAPGFAAQTVMAATAMTVRLAAAGVAQQMTVTAYRTPLGTLESPVSTRLLTRRDLAAAPAATLDDQMRTLPGVETYRRSSSLVANPTSQGISLRGLGSTSASRTLVIEDEAPLNDPLGGWIHWNETPELAIRGVEVVRGGASDLYGSSAIGGVIDLMAARPTDTHAEVNSSYGSNGASENNLLAQALFGRWGLLVSGEMLGTDGYIQEAPWQRGPIDTTSNVHSQSWLADIEHEQGPLRLFVRNSGLNEARHNGTPYQRNATRLVRYATGGDWNSARSESLAVRLFGSDESFRQTFSSILNTPVAADPACTYRCTETPIKYSDAPTNELGAAARWTEPLATKLLLVTGAGVRDIRVWDEEQSFGPAPGISELDDRQRDTGLYAEAMWEPKAWTITGSGRMDWFQNFDLRRTTWSGSGFEPSATQPPQFGERLFDPRLGVSRKVRGNWALVASGFRAFRAATPNELYRATQVGSQLTKANDHLSSERATGWEAGLAHEERWSMVRVAYFLTQVNRPIVAVTISPGSPPILLERENLGQIESRGISMDFEAELRNWLRLDGGYQYAHAVVSRGTQDLGNWIPEVARNVATLNVRASRPRLGDLAVMGRLSGRMYDDDANRYPLHGYFRLDTFASHIFGGRWEIFAAGENLFDRQIEVSKTPTTTLENGRAGRVGVRVTLRKIAN
jgi:outer membrane receptor protein involved in Fe transport